MKHVIYILTSLVAVTFFFCSCDDKEGTIPPTWYGFTYSPSTVHPGDSITITACQASKGDKLNATDYKFTLTLDTLDENGLTGTKEITKSYHTNYGGTDNSNPTMGFRIPEDANYGNKATATCKFEADWSNSADGELGTYAYNGSTSGYYGSITSYCYTLYSNATGSFTFRISSK